MEPLTHDALAAIAREHTAVLARLHAARVCEYCGAGTTRVEAIRAAMAGA